jgi:hypothetical protein
MQLVGMSHGRQLAAGQLSCAHSEPVAIADDGNPISGPNFHLFQNFTRGG